MNAIHLESIEHGRLRMSNGPNTNYGQNSERAFYHGADYANAYLYYDRKDLRQIPALASERFSGVGNPLRIGTIHPGETVLDHACGAGMDLIIAARRVGDTGKVIGIDRSEVMCHYARTAASLAGVAHVTDIRSGLFEDLPVEDESVDVVISNAAINLAANKKRVFSELHRVLRPGGRLFVADLVVQHGLLPYANSGSNVGTSNVSSALPQQALFELAADAGFVNGRVTEHFDCFPSTQSEPNLLRGLGMLGANFFANKRFEIYS